MHKSLPISLDNVKCPKILDFYIVKYAICTQKSDGGHKSNVNKPNGHTLLETPCISSDQKFLEKAKIYYLMYGFTSENS